jgi:hypothetical protein
MQRQVEPEMTLVHGPMPPDVFGSTRANCLYVRYPSDIETIHSGAT